MMNDAMCALKRTLQYVIDGIDNGEFYATERQLLHLSKVISCVFTPTMTRQDVLKELGICDTTLRKKIKDGSIPKGKKIKGMIGHVWSKRAIEDTDVAKRRI